ncbi:SDR family NAD(P)-dependent oxidoreductase [uncultured Shewanella sp.]|uniref:SDR family NAD(P)-dependent oxidoreductase n=1 Tax=uncultured Shewanella sp. TaxID=173975 RepID=UPI0026389DA2|nr:SDR family NAD(P)-dependent oxidoreductase [uncultured Shewanella sp.]
MEQIKKVVIVTGAGRGIGAATAQLLASQGYRVCVNYRVQQSCADTLVSQIRQAGGVAIAVQGDVSQESDVIQLFDQVEHQLGKVTHLVNNAGMLLPQKRLVDLDVARFNQMMQTNVTSCFLCAKEFIQRIDSKGAIVNVSSAAARSGAPFE